MIKSVFKEIIIILLLLFAILALLGVLFYDYIPNKETLPTKAEEYKLADDVKQELEKELSNEVSSEEIIKTYQLDASELEHYEKINEYNKGKVNPFAQYSSGTTGEATGETPSGGNSGNGNSGGNTTSSNNSGTTSSNNSSSGGGTFLNTVGK